MGRRKKKKKSGAPTAPVPASGSSASAAAGSVPLDAAGSLDSGIPDAQVDANAAPSPSSSLAQGAADASSPDLVEPSDEQLRDDDATSGGGDEAGVAQQNAQDEEAAGVAGAEARGGGPPVSAPVALHRAESREVLKQFFESISPHQSPTSSVTGASQAAATAVTSTSASAASVSVSVPPSADVDLAITPLDVASGSSGVVAGDASASADGTDAAGTRTGRGVVVYSDDSDSDSGFDAGFGAARWGNMNSGSNNNNNNNNNNGANGLGRPLQEDDEIEFDIGAFPSTGTSLADSSTTPLAKDEEEEEEEDRPMRMGMGIVVSGVHDDDGEEEFPDPLEYSFQDDTSPAPQFGVSPAPRPSSEANAGRESAHDQGHEDSDARRRKLDDEFEQATRAHDAEMRKQQQQQQQDQGSTSAAADQDQDQGLGQARALILAELEAMRSQNETLVQRVEALSRAVEDSAKSHEEERQRWLAELQASRAASARELASIAEELSAVREREQAIAEQMREEQAKQTLREDLLEEELERLVSAASVSGSPQAESKDISELRAAVAELQAKQEERTDHGEEMKWLLDRVNALEEVVELEAQKRESDRAASAVDKSPTSPASATPAAPSQGSSLQRDAEDEEARREREREAEREQQIADLQRTVMSLRSGQQELERQLQVERIHQQDRDEEWQLQLDRMRTATSRRGSIAAGDNESEYDRDDRGPGLGRSMDSGDGDGDGCDDRNHTQVQDQERGQGRDHIQPSDGRRQKDVQFESGPQRRVRSSSDDSLDEMYRPQSPSRQSSGPTTPVPSPFDMGDTNGTTVSVSFAPFSPSYFSTSQFASRPQSRNQARSAPASRRASRSASVTSPGNSGLNSPSLFLQPFSDMPESPYVGNQQFASVSVPASQRTTMSNPSPESPPLRDRDVCDATISGASAEKRGGMDMSFETRTPAPSPVVGMPGGDAHRYAATATATGSERSGSLLMTEGILRGTPSSFSGLSSGDNSRSTSQDSLVHGTTPAPCSSPVSSSSGGAGTGNAQFSNMFAFSDQTFSVKDEPEDMFAWQRRSTPAFVLSAADAARFAQWRREAPGAPDSVMSTRQPSPQSASASASRSAKLLHSPIRKWKTAPRPWRKRDPHRFRVMRNIRGHVGGGELGRVNGEYGRSGFEMRRSTSGGSVTGDAGDGDDDDDDDDYDEYEDDNHRPFPANAPQQASFGSLSGYQARQQQGGSDESPFKPVYHPTHSRHHLNSPQKRPYSDPHHLVEFARRSREARARRYSQAEEAEIMQMLSMTASHEAVAPTSAQASAFSLPPTSLSFSSSPATQSAFESRHSSHGDYGPGSLRQWPNAGGSLSMTLPMTLPMTSSSMTASTALPSPPSLVNQPSSTSSTGELESFNFRPSEQQQQLQQQLEQQLRQQQRPHDQSQVVYGSFPNMSPTSSSPSSSYTARSPPAAPPTTPWDTNPTPTTPVVLDSGSYSRHEWSPTNGSPDTSSSPGFAFDNQEGQLRGSSAFAHLLGLARGPGAASSSAAGGPSVNRWSADGILSQSVSHGSRPPSASAPTPPTTPVVPELSRSSSDGRPLPFFSADVAVGSAPVAFPVSNSHPPAAHVIEEFHVIEEEEEEEAEAEAEAAAEESTVDEEEEEEEEELLQDVTRSIEMMGQMQRVFHRKSPQSSANRSSGGGVGWGGAVSADADPDASAGYPHIDFSRLPLHRSISQSIPNMSPTSTDDGDYGDGRVGGHDHDDDDVASPYASLTPSTTPVSQSSALSSARAHYNQSQPRKQDSLSITNNSRKSAINASSARSQKQRADDDAKLHRSPPSKELLEKALINSTRLRLRRKLKGQATKPTKPSPDSARSSRGGSRTPANTPTPYDRGGGEDLTSPVRKHERDHVQLSTPSGGRRRLKERQQQHKHQQNQ